MRNRLIFLTVGTAILNGMFSPLLLFIFLLRWTWYPYFIPQYQEIATLVSALILSTLTLMISGVPAALYERTRPAGETDTTSALIWLAGAVLITLPAVPNILRALGWT